MLSREHRLHRAADFTEVVRRGRRSSRPLLSVHLLLLGPDAPAVDAGSSGSWEPTAWPARAGLVVSKAVGGSVARSTVSRRLRHLLRSRVPSLPSGARLVVRAGPSAATAGSSALAADLDAALTSALRPRAARPSRTAPRPAPHQGDA